MLENQSPQEGPLEQSAVTGQQRTDELAWNQAIVGPSMALLSGPVGGPNKLQPILRAFAIRFWNRSVPALTSCLVASVILALHCSPARASNPPQTTDRVIEKGVASYYSRYYQGRRTASGGRYNPKKLTAAHPWLPLGTKVRVTAANGRSVDVVVTDRMSAAHRIIDLSYQAAQALGIVRQGVAYVSVAGL